MVPNGADGRYGHGDFHHYNCYDGANKENHDDGRHYPNDVFAR